MSSLKRIETIELEAPQNQGPFHAVEMAIRASIKEQYARIRKLGLERAGALKDFKGLVSLKFLEVEQMVDGIRKMFEDFSLREDPKIEGSQVLSKGHKFYLDQMQINSGRIIKGLEEEIARVEKMNMLKQEEMHAQVQKTLETYRSAMTEATDASSSLRSLTDAASGSKSLTDEKLRAAIKTMRRLPIFGTEYQNKIDFEWPKEQDVLAMPRDKPFTLSALSYKPSEHNVPLGSFQMHFSNGVDSPKFLANNQSGRGLQRVDIPQDKKVDTIRCRVDGNGSDDIYEIILLDKEGSQFVHIKQNQNCGNFYDRQLEQDEEIIGCYGVKHEGRYFDSIGFIVWKPP